MPVTFDDLRIGEEYERPQLAEHWGYVSHHAISRGVITPKGTRYIILFVTKEKQEFLTQYQDSIEGDILHWEGEEKHGSDDRIIHSRENGDEIHLFYRERHHSPFVYLGPITLLNYEQRTDAPSSFIFRVDAFSNDADQDPFEDVDKHSKEFETLPETERKAIVQSRVGQGRFRRDVLQLWNGCAVTGIADSRVLLASHVKPWRIANNEERLDPHNGLALIPNLDTLFDDGLITFDAEGRIRISNAIDQEIVHGLGAHPDMRLRMMPSRLEQYLRFHRKFVYQGPWDKAWGELANEGDI